MQRGPEIKSDYPGLQQKRNTTGIKDEDGYDPFITYEYINLSFMIHISEKAKIKIGKLRAESQLTEEHFLRVGVVGGGCSGLSYKLDFDNETQPNDQVFEQDGVKVVTDLKSFLYLCDTTLDFSEGLDGKGFHFINPNATRTCGCGESFSV